MTERRAPGHPPAYYHHLQQHSHPVLAQRRGQGRRLPPTPNKPSTLQLHPSSINFPKLNTSPTRGSLGAVVGPLPPVQHCPLSFEQAVAMGRGGRMLPSPVPNGYKPQPPLVGTQQLLAGPGKARSLTRSRHSDSDEDDWC